MRDDYHCKPCHDSGFNCTESRPCCGVINEIQARMHQDGSMLLKWHFTFDKDRGEYVERKGSAI